jgi:probable rRNA maturation factor
MKAMNNIISVKYEKGIRPAITKNYLQRIAEITIRNLNIQNNIEMGIVITDDAQIKELNRNYRNINNSTDVLSFHMNFNEDKELSADFISPPDHIKHIGEVIISYETAVRQAKQNSITVKDELSFLLVHGILHLMNYDHMEEHDREIMEEKEKAIFDKITFNRKQEA